jgi:hypothetical protein
LGKSAGSPLKNAVVGRLPAVQAERPDETEGGIGKRTVKGFFNGLPPRKALRAKRHRRCGRAAQERQTGNRQSSIGTPQWNAALLTHRTLTTFSMYLAAAGTILPARGLDAQTPQRRIVQ